MSELVGTNGRGTSPESRTLIELSEAGEKFMSWFNSIEAIFIRSDSAKHIFLEAMELDEKRVKFLKHFFLLENVAQIAQDVLCNDTESDLTTLKRAFRTKLAAFIAKNQFEISKYPSLPAVIVEITGLHHSKIDSEGAKNIFLDEINVLLRLFFADLFLEKFLEIKDSEIDTVDVALNKHVLSGAGIQVDLIPIRQLWFAGKVSQSITGLMASIDDLAMYDFFLDPVQLTRLDLPLSHQLLLIQAMIMVSKANSTLFQDIFPGVGLDGFLSVRDSLRLKLFDAEVYFD